MYDCIQFQYIYEHVSIFFTGNEARGIVRFDLFFHFFLSKVFGRGQSHFGLMLHGILIDFC